jgi:hypothetical protein
MKQLTILALLGMAISASAQTKQYARPNPTKAYTVSLKASAIDSLIMFVNTGAASLYDSELQAKEAKKLNMAAAYYQNVIYSQVRAQIVADSLADERLKAKKP